MTTERQSDEMLMLAYAAGDAEAFDTLFGRYRTRLYRLLARLSGDPGLAEDLVQKVFLRVHEARKRYRPGAPFRTWIVGIAFNLWKDELARSHRRHEILVGYDPSERRGSGADGEGSESELCGLVRRAVLSLPEGQRAVLVLSRYHDMSYDEVAVALGISVGAVKLKAHRAFERLRKLLRDRYEESRVPRNRQNAV
jgi:RNA polymerase sigma factor (sigma-70 family)